MGENARYDIVCTSVDNEFPIQSYMTTGLAWAEGKIKILM